MSLSPPNTSNISENNLDTSNSWAKIEFSLFLVGQVFSIPCYLFVIYHYLAHKSIRRALYNHVIILLLFFNFIDLTIDLSMTMNYTLLGYVFPFSPSLCLIWQFVDYGVWYGSISLMFWASVERHFLVFHPDLIRTKRRRLFFHYGLLAFFTFYTSTLYFYLIFMCSCNRTFDPTSVRCGSICYLDVAETWFIYYDSLANYTIPILLIAVFSSALVLRFIQQKRHFEQPIRWHQCRKMIIQLSLVSISYLIFDLPYIIIIIVQSSGYPNFALNIMSPYISHLVYVPSIVFPYATLLSLPQLKQKLRALLICKRIRRVVAPSTVL